MRAPLEASPASVSAIARAISLARSWIERGALRAGSFGQHRAFSGQAEQSALLATVQHGGATVHQRSGGGEHLVVRTDVNVVLSIIEEVAM